MSSDIVKRLREYAEAEASGRYGWICSRDPKNLIFWTAADRIEAAEAEVARLKDALTRCQAIGCSQVKEIAQRAISSLPISDCSCKIEMGSFRFRGSHCIVCGGVIG